MKRMYPISIIVAVFVGWLIAGLTGTPQEGLADSRPSLASLQAQINSITDGTTPVGRALNADLARDAGHASHADGASWAMSAEFAQRSYYADFANQTYWSDQSQHATEADHAVFSDYVLNPY